jgi:hypothetical protein
MKIFIAVQMTSTLVSIVWLLYVWIKDSNFGSQPECNHLIKYVLVFKNVRATETWLRVIFIIYLVLNSCVMLLTFGIIFLGYFYKGIQRMLRDVSVHSGAEPAEQGRRARRRTFPGKVRIRVYLSAL